MSKSMSAKSVAVLGGKIKTLAPTGALYLYVGSAGLTFKNKRGATLFTHEGSGEDAVSLALLLAVDGRRVVVKNGAPGGARIDHVWAKEGTYVNRVAEREAAEKAAQAALAELEKAAKLEAQKEALAAEKAARKSRKAKDEAPAGDSPAPEGAPAPEAPPAGDGHAWGNLTS
jgi:hypothetical protein